MSTDQGKKQNSNSQGGYMIWHGLTVGRFCQLMVMRPDLNWSRAHRVLSLLPSTVHNSFWSTIESLVYGRSIARAEVKPPVFILGHWRSGTTLLHNLLTLDEQFTFPNLYHAVFPTHFLVTEKAISSLTKNLLPSSRPMDNMKAAWDLPQEDEFALLNLCLLSPYMMLGFQGNRRHVYERFFSLEDASPKEVELWKKTLLRFMKKVTIREDKPIVMKSPSHTMKVPTILEMFPDARFIYIYRNPYNVVRSTNHLRAKTFPVNTLGKPDLSCSEDDAFYIYKKCIKRYEETKSLIPTENLFEVRYEDFELDPLAEFAKIYDQFGLSNFDGLKEKLEPKLAELRNYKKNKFEQDEDWKRHIYSQAKEIFEMYGYPSELEEEAESRSSENLVA